ncbi:hypothetical protein LTR56_022536 [Elasticomyces elasticus]|nr:hypothetical protein LTR56_022536 [Elasticomyces elasticus]KAK3638955.1 hypothetical protein LTR22_017642 [Elasticomyces elasticus]KAK4931355.1 hypothetical protein LTR49_002056 [Elasticomyces elasticus]KAK5752592.1 hypothetical protein LTS12_017345 [Elasticomyces elasticus]
MSQAYQWLPLTQAKSTIRLLNILPRRSDIDYVLRLSLFAADLGEVGCNYDAVSYSWGSAEDTRLVLIDGRHTWVRKNLWAFLIHCRDTPLRHHPNLWADALCIDQDNDDEKSIQVQLMRRIYSSAYQVIAWLGDWSLQTALPGYIAAYGAEWSMGLDECKAIGRSPWDYIDVPHGTNRLAAIEDDSIREIIEADMRKLCRSVYWSRLWPVQELVLAQKPVFVAGTHLISVYVLLKNLPDIFPTPKSGHHTDFLDVDHAVLRSLKTCWEWGTSEQRSMIAVVSELADHECCDLRDHVYGLLGVVENGHNFDVDYGKDVEEVYLNALDFSRV